MHLVTGFLGSGKSTLINSVLMDPGFARSLVIVNEFGDVGLDHLMVSSADDQVVLLDSGCLCCAASGSLRDTLIDLFARRASGRVPAFDRIIVETSGLAHPAPLVASLLGDSALRSRCTLSQVLTLVDAALGEQALERYAEARRQVAFADRLVISKTDTATSGDIDALLLRFMQINSEAAIVRWQQGQPAAAIFERVEPIVRTLAPQAWMRGPRRPQYGDDASAVTPDDPDAHGAFFAHITTRSFTFDAALNWERYAALTHALSMQLGRRLLRCKGLLALGEDTKPWVVQGVQGYFAPPSQLPKWPTTERQGFLVCIGESIPRSELEAIVASVDPVSFSKH